VTKITFNNDLWLGLNVLIKKHADQKDFVLSTSARNGSGKPAGIPDLVGLRRRMRACEHTHALATLIRDDADLERTVRTGGQNQ
jgi:hypothetical protein